MPKEDVKSQDDAEWNRRKLCSDGNCIGVIGPDGFCKECGKPGDADTEGSGAEVAVPESDSLLLDEEDLPEETDEEAEVDDDDWDNRLLCSDENCIGVVGPNGRCKECGKPYKGQ